jgi:hypothetical protein
MSLLNDLFWPQTTTADDDICIQCAKLRHEGHAKDCLYVTILALLEELEWSQGQCPDCRAFLRPRATEQTQPGLGQHKPNCRLGVLLAELRKP